VAVVNLAAGGAPAVSAIAVGKRPQGITGAGATVYVANSGDGTLTLLDASTGKAIGDAHAVAALKAPVVGRTAVASVARKSGKSGVTFTVALSGAPLTSRDLVKADGRIAAGSARFLLWRGGAQTRVQKSAAGGATLRIGTAAGRVVLTLTAKAKAFTSATAHLDRAGSRVVLTLKAAAVVTPPPSPTPPSPSPSPTPTPPPPPPPEIG
jgi:hypothetical protein